MEKIKMKKLSKEDEIMYKKVVELINDTKKYHSAMDISRILDISAYKAEKWIKIYIINSSWENAEKFKTLKKNEFTYRNIPDGYHPWVSKIINKLIERR